MDKILELIKKRNQAWDAAKAYIEAHKDADGLLSPEHEKAYQELENKVLNFTREIERMQREQQIESQLAQPINNPILTKPSVEKADEKLTAKAEYKQAMLDAIRSNFKRVSNILQEGVEADGGYLVPEEYDSRLIVALEEENIVRKLGKTIKTQGNHKINIAASNPAAAWIDEGGELQFTDAKFKQVLLDAHKLHVAVKITEELLYDNAFNLENHIITEFGKAIANAEEDAFLNGDGSNKPTGIFHETNGGERMDKLTAAIKADDILSLIYELKRPYRKNAAFIMNDKIIAQIRKLKDNNGAYIWQQSYQAGEPDTILGYKVFTSAYAPEDAIAFGDFSYYNIGDRGNRTFQELRELFAGNGMVAFLAKVRVDGRLILPEAVKILPLNKG